jgi:mannosyltransferase
MSTALAPRIPQRRALRRAARSPLLAPAMGVVGGAIAFAGAGTPSYWGDEAASVMSAQRPLSSLFGELAHIDAVHGLYYLFLHFWVGAFGTSEAVVRFPSAVAAGFAIAGTVALGRRLLGTSGGIVAGAVVAVLPELTRMAIEARSYSFGMAAAVWLTWLLVGLVRRHETRKRRWVLYAVGAALSVYLFLYLALLVVVHLVVVVAERPPAAVVRRWLQALVFVVLVTVPFVAVALTEQHQIAFLAQRDYATVTAVLVRQWFRTPVVAVIAWALILAGIAVTALISRHRARHFRRGQVIALAWVVLPTAILLAGNAWIAPMYNMRYAAFCLPGVAIAIAAGIV